MERSAVPPGIAIVGCGTVGGAAAILLTRDRELITGRAGVPLELRHIVDLKFDHARELGLPEKLFGSDLDAALRDPEVGVVVELVGGTGFAKEVIRRALEAGKHVVTANKALLAHDGPELLALARRNGVSVAFEASCGGGIPIIRALVDGLIANRIDALYGIVNGTCNYILTEMTQEGQSYEEALTGAQDAGFAEADPYLDVSGMDSAHKLTLLGSLAFGCSVELESLTVEGIDSLQPIDVRYGEELGYIVKLLAIAERMEGGFNFRIRPSFISLEHPLAWVSGPFNAVSVYGHATGHTMYYGRGAGGFPTASAIVSDIAACVLGTAETRFAREGIWPDRAEKARIVTIDRVRSRYYVRIMAEDTPGVLADITAIFGRHGISISSVLQQELPEDHPVSAVPVVITTHTAREGDIRKALEQVNALSSVLEPATCISILDEHPEKL